MNLMLCTHMQRLKEEYAPWLVPMHCMAHRVNLVSKCLSGCDIMELLEFVQAKVYTYFSHRCGSAVGAF